MSEKRLINQTRCIGRNVNRKELNNLDKLHCFVSDRTRVDIYREKMF